MPRSGTLAALADLTAGQRGLFTRRQAEATGMAWTTVARLVNSGVAERAAHGVYRLRAVPDLLAAAPPPVFGQNMTCGRR